jgi:HNH endonuclease
MGTSELGNGLDGTIAGGGSGHARAGAMGWQQAHEALSRLARRRAVMDADEGRCLLAAVRVGAHLHLGFGTFAEYVERLFGYSPRSTYEKLRVAEALEGLPALALALEEGALSWSALRELTRVASAETERAWLALSRGKTVRQLQNVVAGARPGDGPDSPREPGARRHVLRFEVSPETFASFREASAHLRRQGDPAFDDDAILLAMARAVLGGPADDGRASYQVSLSVCSECGRAEQRANGALVAVGPEIVALASCDAQHIGLVTAPANDNPTSSDAGLDAHADAHADASSSCQTASVRARVGSGARPARQTVPPALRRAILHRDHHRCGVPGCTNATFLDLHHIQPRSEGGGNDAANLLGICGAHHRAVHRGQLIIERAAEGLRFSHGDGRPYGELGAPTALEVNGRSIEIKVASALRNLGFRDADARTVLSELRREASARNTPDDDAPRGVTTEWLLREALVRLGPRRSARR